MIVIQTYYCNCILKELQRRYLLCSCHSTVTLLKKYVAQKIFLNQDKYKELDIVLDDEPLGKDHTLKFIQVTFKKDKVKIKFIFFLNNFEFFVSFFFKILRMNYFGYIFAQKWFIISLPKLFFFFCCIYGYRKLFDSLHSNITHGLHMLLCLEFKFG